jgi:dihydrofolate reductase
MSLDGYVADRNDGVGEVFDWYMNSGDVEFHTGGSDPMTFRVSEPSAEHLRALWSELGAVITGRRTFEVAEGWGGNHAWGPAFVVTHAIPEGWPRAGSTVHFVTDGIESAVKQAKAAAGAKSVAVHGADTIQQLLNAGLLDDICVDVAALFLGSGVRLFDHPPALRQCWATRRWWRESASRICDIRCARRSSRAHAGAVRGRRADGDWHSPSLLLIF